jgi:hypothetical protein
VGWAATRAAVETSASKAAAGEAAASEDLEEASATAADGVATTAAIEGASKTAHEGVAAGAAEGRAAASTAVDGAAGAAAADGEGPIAMALALLVPFKGPGVSRAPAPPLTLVIHSPDEIYYTGAHKNHLSACD